MSLKQLLVDIDGTLARFHDEVNYLERMFEEGFFENLKPFENTVEAIRLLIKNHPELVVRSCSAVVDSPFCIREKDIWMDRHLPEIAKKDRIYTNIGKSKAEYIDGDVTKDIYLLDDYNKGLHMFRYDGGSAIKCHNNINQKGMGAHGGERGYMWEGPMIHAFDPPELIAEELAQLIGLEHNIEKAGTSSAIFVQLTKPPTDRSSNISNQKKQLQQITVTNGDVCFLALNKGTHGFDKSTIFQNPYSALRYLNGDKLAREYNIRSYDGRMVTATGYQLLAICQNAYGSTDFHRYLRADRTQLAEEVLRSFQHREDAVVGFVCELNPDGEEFARTAYYRYEDMLQRIKFCEEHNREFHAEWFIQPFVLNGRMSLYDKIQEAQQRANETFAYSAQEKGPDIE